MDLYIQLEKIDAKQNEILHLVKSLSNSDIVKQDKVYDLTDLEEILHVCRRTLFKWQSEGKITFNKVGKKLYFTQKELDRFLNNSTNY